MIFAGIIIGIAVVLFTEICVAAYLMRDFPTPYDEEEVFNLCQEDKADE